MEGPPGEGRAAGARARGGHGQGAGHAVREARAHPQAHGHDARDLGHAAALRAARRPAPGAAAGSPALSHGL